MKYNSLKSKRATIRAALRRRGYYQRIPGGDRSRAQMWLLRGEPGDPVETRPVQVGTTVYPSLAAAFEAELP